MLSGARILWGTATNAITNVAERLDNIVKESLADDNIEDIESRQEDIEAYKKLLNELEIQQVELSKQSRIALAHKEAEIDLLKSRLKEFLPNDPSLLSIDDNKDTLEYAKIKAERDVLNSTIIDLQEQLQIYMKEISETKFYSNKLEELEKKYNRTRNELNMRIQEIELSEKQKSDTIEELVGEYSKLAAESEQQKNKDSKFLKDVLKDNEVLNTKVQALELALSNIADKTPETARVSESHGLSGTEQVDKDQKAMLESLRKELKEKNVELETAATNYQHLRDELKKAREASSTPAPTPLKNLSNLSEDEASIMSKQLKSTQTALSNLEVSYKELKEAFEKEKIEKQNLESTKNLVLEEKNETIKKLNDQIQSIKDNSNNQSNLEIVDLNEKIDLLNKKCKTLEDDLSSSKLETSRKTDEFNLEKELFLKQLSERESVVNNSVSQIKSLQSEIEELKLSSFQSKDEAAASLEKLQKSRSDEINQYVETISGLKNTIVKLENEIVEIKKLNSETLTIELEKAFIKSQEDLKSAIGTAVDENTKNLKESATIELENLKITLQTSYLEAETALKLESQQNLEKALLEAKKLAESNMYNFAFLYIKI